MSVIELNSVGTAPVRLASYSKVRCRNWVSREKAPWDGASQTVVAFGIESSKCGECGERAKFHGYATRQ